MSGGHIPGNRDHTEEVAFQGWQPHADGRLGTGWHMSDTLPPSTETPEDARRATMPRSVNVQTLAFTLICVAIVILLLQFMQPVLLPLVLAGLLFYALDRPVGWLQNQRVPRAIGAAVMMLMVISSCGALAYSLQGQALTVIDQLPTGAIEQFLVLQILTSAAVAVAWSASACLHRPVSSCGA
jgi:hypothetical protein